MELDFSTRTLTPTGAEHLKASTFPSFTSMDRLREFPSMISQPSRERPRRRDSILSATSLNSMVTPPISQIQDHGDLVAVGKFRTLHAVSPYLVGKLVLVHHPEAEFREEFRFVGETEDPLEPEQPPLVDTGLHHLGADAAT